MAYGFFRYGFLRMMRGKFVFNGASTQERKFRARFTILAEDKVHDIVENAMLDVMREIVGEGNLTGFLRSANAGVLKRQFLELSHHSRLDLVHVVALYVEPLGH